MREAAENIIAHGIHKLGSWMKGDRFEFEQKERAKKDEELSARKKLVVDTRRNLKAKKIEEKRAVSEQIDVAGLLEADVRGQFDSPRYPSSWKQASHSEVEHRKGSPKRVMGKSGNGVAGSSVVANLPGWATSGAIPGELSAPLRLEDRRREREAQRAAQLEKETTAKAREKSPGQIAAEGTMSPRKTPESILNATKSFSHPMSKSEYFMAVSRRHGTFDPRSLYQRQV